jgi:hypothetical protein
VKIYKAKKIIAKNINDCKGWRSAFGLRFKKSFKPYDAFLIHMLWDSILDSYLVPIEFIAVWLDKNYKALKVEHCVKNKFYHAVKNQHLVLELPASKNGLIKKGDKLVFDLEVD